MGNPVLTVWQVETCVAYGGLRRTGEFHPLLLLLLFVA